MVKNAGRPLKDVDDTFTTKTPDRVMARLISMKNAGYSWRRIAEEIGYTGSPATLWKVAKGQMRSKEIEHLLGYRPPTRVRFAADIPPVLRDQLTAERDALGMTNGEFLSVLWRRYKLGKKDRR